MCGIAGYFGRFEPNLLARMTQLIERRGPDDFGQYFSPDGSVALGHRRLAIIDLAPTGHQPMVSADGRLTIIFNGEIYNYRELRQQLARQGVTFRGHSDTEVLLELFSREGMDCLARLNGIFAFAIWDSGQRILTLARDGIGVKPLYYAETKKGFLFASELKAILASRDVPREYDRNAVAHYMTYLWAPSPETPLRAVRKLEPGEWVHVQEGRILRRGKFYELPAPSDPGRTPLATIEQLEQTLSAAVARQLVADVPVGAFLSGGVDSSAIVAFAKDYVAKPLECFTVRLSDGDATDDGMEPDLPYARRVAQHFGVTLHEVPVDNTAIANDVDWMVAQLDEPQADPACLNTHYICRFARDRGYKVMLAGTGGDDLFSGYRRHVALQAEQLWDWLPSGARRLLVHGSARARPFGSLGRRIAKALEYADLDPANRIVSYFFWTHPGITQALLPDAEPDVGLPLKMALEKRPEIRSPLDQMLFLETRFFLADHNLAYTDKMSMATGVEVRVPLVDYEVVRFASTIPAGLKQRRSIGKWVLKRAVEKRVPREVIERPKTGFGVPLRAWLQGPLRERMEELLSPSSVRQLGMFEPKTVETVKNKTLSGEWDGTYTLFALMCLALWHNHYMRVDA
jgi:asparagine synthase (glutamine-hydrolysing)